MSPISAQPRHFFGEFRGSKKKSAARKASDPIVSTTWIFLRCD
jgi:hypothetical protein